MNVTHLECALCGLKHEARRLLNLCTKCGKPLLVRYDLEQAARSLTKESLRGRRADLWRYREVLPVDADEHIISLGEGWTPLLHARALGEQLGFRELYIKDESQNPTQSFKARGMAAAVSMAKELGAQKLAVPSAGNAAGALAAYAACLKEPYRVEGKKTLGYELAEQLDWELPDVIIYPTGGGTGLIGMWKAFDEMEQMGWIGSKRPKMVTVQAAGCAPIVRAFEAGKRFADEFPNAQTTASGLRVPRAIGDFLILDAIRASGGTAMAVTDEQLITATREIGAAEGVFCAPEGAACLPALRKLVEAEQVGRDERVVLFNTGAGVKYLESFSS